MKILVFLTILINLLVLVITQDEEQPSQEIDDGSQQDDAIANNMCGKEIGPTCANDCKTLMSCLRPNAAPVEENECYKYNPDKPYCVNGTCTNIKDASNPNCNAQFLCTSMGTFPDPTDCTIFHSCKSASDTSPITSQCPPTHTYNSIMKTCKSTKECQKIDCAKKPNQIVSFTYDKAYYAYCYESPEGFRETYMYKCEDEVNYIYDVALKKCIYNCKADGNFVNRANCNGYISCYKVSGKFVYAEMDCPPGYYFNKTQCVPNGATNCISEMVPVEENGSSDDGKAVPETDSKEGIEDPSETDP